MNRNILYFKNCSVIFFMWLYMFLYFILFNVSKVLRINLKFGKGHTVHIFSVIGCNHILIIYIRYPIIVWDRYCFKFNKNKDSLLYIFWCIKISVNISKSIWCIESTLIIFDGNNFRKNRIPRSLHFAHYICLKIRNFCSISLNIIIFY